MVIYTQDFDLPPDISQKLLQPITEEQANRLLNDTELRAECERTGVDLGLLVNSLRRSVQERWARHKQALRMAQAFRSAGRDLGYS